MDENEAIKKTCPLFFHAAITVAAIHKPKSASDLTEASTCIGSSCGWWVKTGERVEYTGCDIGVKLPGGGGRVEKETRTINMGRCGIALRNENC